MHPFRAAAQSGEISQIREILALDVTSVDTGGQPGGDERASLRQPGRAERPSARGAPGPGGRGLRWPPWRPAW
jgi:hypothetical protein